MRTCFVLCSAICFLGLPGTASAGESASLPPAEWLASQLPLGSTEQSVAARFGRSAPHRNRNGELVVMTFAEAPAGVSWPAHDHRHDGHGHAAESCDTAPPWSFQFRNGGLISALLTLPEPQAAASVLPGRTPLTLQPEGEPIPFAVWRLGGERLLVAPGFEGPGEQVRQLLMLDEKLLGILYPRVAAALRQRAPNVSRSE